MLKVFYNDFGASPYRKKFPNVVIGVLYISLLLHPQTQSVSASSLRLAPPTVPEYVEHDLVAVNSPNVDRLYSNMGSTIDINTDFVL